MLTKLAAQHNQQRTTQSIADDRYEIRWEKSTAPLVRRGSRRGITWLLIGDDSDAVQPLVDVLTARGHRHRILGLPASDADEEQLADALRAAAADDPTLRIVHVAALDSDSAPSMRSLLRMQHRILGGTRRLFRAAIAAELRSADLGGDPWRTTSHRRGHRVAGSELPVGIRSCRLAGASARVGRTGGSVSDRARADEWSRFINQVVATPHASAQGRPDRAARSGGLCSPAGSAGRAAERHAAATAR